MTSDDESIFYIKIIPILVDIKSHREIQKHIFLSITKNVFRYDVKVESIPQYRIRNKYSIFLWFYQIRIL